MSKTREKPQKANSISWRPLFKARFQARAKPSELAVQARIFLRQSDKTDNKRYGAVPRTSDRPIFPKKEVTNGQSLCRSPLHDRTRPSYKRKTLPGLLIVRSLW